MDFEEFREYLLLPSNVDEELREIDGAIDRSALCSWIAKILANWDEVSRDLTTKEQNSVLWRIGSYPLFIGFWLLRSSDLTFEEKSRLLNAAKFVSLAIPNRFAPEAPMENGYYMWWDLLAKNIEEAELADVCLEILADLSLHSDDRVQAAALHGLGHLQHPDRPKVVDEFIRRHPDLEGRHLDPAMSRRHRDVKPGVISQGRVRLANVPGI